MDQDRAANGGARWNAPDDRLYDRRHQWYIGVDGVYTVGVSDYLQDTAGDVLYVSLPESGSAVSRGEPLGSIESGKWVGQIYAPCDGTVESVNGRFQKEPGLLNRDPYREGWLVQIRPRAGAKWEPLMSAAQYLEVLCDEEPSPDEKRSFAGKGLSSDDGVPSGEKTSPDGEEA